MGLIHSPRRVLVMAGCAALCAGLASGMDTAISYQGVLNVSSSPANGSFDFRFILYDAEIGGSQVGPILYGDDIDVEDGLFTVHLNFGTGVFTGDDRWLEIAVRAGAETGAYTLLSPRQAVLPSPYSLHADEVSWSDIVDIPAGYANDADSDPSNELQTISLDGSTLTLSQDGGSVVIPAGDVIGYTTVPSAGFGTSQNVTLAEVSFTLSQERTVLILADANPWANDDCHDTISLEIDGVLEGRTAVLFSNLDYAPTNNAVSVSTSWMQTFSTGAHTIRLGAFGGCPAYMHPHLHVLVLGN